MGGGQRTLGCDSGGSEQTEAAASLSTNWSPLAEGEEVQPEWRSLYKHPLSKWVADLQRRTLQGFLAVNTAVSDTCSFCGPVETVAHCFTGCPYLLLLFALLDTLFKNVGEVYCLRLFTLDLNIERLRRTSVRS